MEQKQNLQELFRLTFGHSNYPGGIAGLFTFEPTEAGQKTLNAYGLHFRTQTNNFMVIAPFSEKVGNDCQLARPFNSDAVLAFAVFSNDPYFLNKSNLPIDPPGKYVYYLNNLDETKERTSLLLETGGITADLRVQLHTKSFSFPLADAENISVLDCRGQLVPKTGYDQQTDTIKNIYLIDLSRKPDGLYTIVNGALATEYYCVKASFIRRVPLIIIELFVDAAVPVDYQVVKIINGMQYIDQKSFELLFGIYSAYWKYKLIPVNISISQWLKVLTSDGEITFDPPKLKVNSNQEPMVFISEQVMSIDNQTIQIFLYRSHWNTLCYWHGSNRYSHCGENYGIYINGVFKCRYEFPPGSGAYPYPCPAALLESLIGNLPRPNEVATLFYKENDKRYAEMTLYVRYAGGNYTISES